MRRINCSLFHFCDNHGPTILFTTKLIHGNPESLSHFLSQVKSEKSKSYQCSNCTSLDSVTPFIVSSSDEKDLHVVSGRSLFQSQDEAARINHIGVRLLSCETPDENNSIVFCDNIVGGIIIGINFFIRDETARGFQKKFSIAIIGSDNTEDDDLAANNLISKLSEVTSSLNKVANQIQFECSNNVIGNKRDQDLFINAKKYHDDMKEDETDEESIMAKCPTIDYVNLHRQFSFFLIDLCQPMSPQKQSSIPSQVRKCKNSNENCNITLKEIYNAMSKEEFTVLLEVIVLVDTDIEFHCSYKSLLHGVVDCFVRLLPYEEDLENELVNNILILKLNKTHQQNNKITVNIATDNNYFNLNIVEFSNEHKKINRTKYYLIDKILQVLENDRIQEGACEEYINALKTKYVSLANVTNKMKKSEKKDSKCISIQSKAMKDLIMSANLPLTEEEIIVRWSKLLSES